MTTVLSHLDIRSPLVWVVSDEPRRVVFEVCLNKDRPIFKMDILDGLTQYIKTEWKVVLVKTGVNEEGQDILEPITSKMDALLYVYNERGIFILENAHLTLFQGQDPNAGVVGFLQKVAQSYMAALLEDDNAKVPMAVIMISCHERVPAELARDIQRITLELPNADELGAYVSHISVSSKLDISNITKAHIVRAGLGMSEHEFFSASAQSLKDKHTLTPEYINEIKIANLKRDGILEVRPPAITMDDIGGLDLLKEILHRTSWIWNNPEEAEKAKVQPLRRLLLIGVSGAGKSAAAEAAASMLKLDLARFGASHVMSKFVGESEQNMRKAFDQVKAMSPIVLWVDEFGRDMSGSGSSNSVDGGTTDRVHGEFLTGMQELPDNVFFVGAANRIEDLPPEMLRADRFDKIMFIGFPTQSEREAIFEIHLGAEDAPHYDVEALAKATATFTGAEIKALIKEVRFKVVGDHHRAPVTEDLLRWAPKLKGRIWRNHRPAIISMYERAQLEWDWASSDQENEAPLVLEAARGASVAPASSAGITKGSKSIEDIMNSAFEGKKTGT